MVGSNSGPDGGSSDEHEADDASTYIDALVSEVKTKTNIGECSLLATEL